MYLNFMLKELKSGRYAAPLHTAALLLHYIEESSKSGDGLRCGEYVLDDIMKVIRVALIANSYNIKINNDFACEEKPESVWIEDTAVELFNKVKNLNFRKYLHL